MSWWTPECLPDGRRQAGDRHLNFHKGRDNLSGRGGNAYCYQLGGLSLDLDVLGPNHKSGLNYPPTYEDARALIASFPVKPSCIVESGGGYQPWWLFTEPVEAKEIEPLLTKWGGTWDQIAKSRGWEIDNTSKIERIMRLPGTINRKPGCNKMARVIEATWERYSPSHFEPHLLGPAKSAIVETWAPRRPEGGERPGDAYNRTHSISDELAELGFTFHHRDDRAEHWTRPGKDPRSGSSATVYKDNPEKVYVFTSSLREMGIEPNRTYDAYGLHVVNQFGGDFSAASAALRSQGYGDQEPGASPPSTVGASSFPVLSEEFWQARPAFQQIRQAAYSRQRSAGAVMVSVLCRVAAACDYRLELPPLVGSSAPLCLFALIVAPPGIGKSTANDIARELLALTDLKNFADQLPVGTGEGLIEALFGKVQIDDGKGGTTTVKCQVRANAFVYVDEGEVLSALGGRSGSTLLSTLRSIWSGKTVGQSNASEDRKRILQAGTYTFGVVVALQDTKAAALLDDAAAGTPQRFIWASAMDRGIPGERPSWPGKLMWVPTRLSGTEPLPLGVESAVVAEIRAADLAKVRGEVRVADMEGHGHLLRLKVAGLLALLDNRATVTEEDWRLAGMLKDYSDAVRDHVRAAVRAETTQKEHLANMKQAKRENFVDDAKNTHRVKQCARTIAQKAVARPGLTVSGLRRAMRRWGEVFDDGLDAAVASNWVEERSEPGQGTDKRALYPRKPPFGA